MGWTMLKERSRSAEGREFDEAMEMAKEGVERLCELAKEMREQYGERNSMGYRSGSMGYRGGYGERDEMDGYGERRGRDSRGRYM